MAGAGHVVVGHDGHHSFVRRLRAESPLCLRAPRRTPGSAAWIMVGSLGGGLVDGDGLSLEVEVEAHAQALLTTQASTKAYRGTGSSRIRATVGALGTLVLAPDPLVCFAGARCAQTTEIDLAPDASLVLYDVLGAGRVARGERWDFEGLDTSLRVRRGGALVIDDGLALHAADGSLRDRMGHYDALATLLLLGPEGSAALESLHERSWGAAEVLVAASPVGGGALIRLAATTMAAVLAETRRLVAPALARVGDPFRRQPGNGPADCLLDSGAVES